MTTRPQKNRLIETNRDSGTVECNKCGVTYDDGKEMVQCDVCYIWVHTRCFGYVKSDDSFECDRCRGRHVGGIAGGDRAMFDGSSSSDFTHDPWKASGYKAKKLGHPYKEFSHRDHSKDEVEISANEGADIMMSSSNTALACSKDIGENKNCYMKDGNRIPSSQLPFKKRPLLPVKNMVAEKGKDYGNSDLHLAKPGGAVMIEERGGRPFHSNVENFKSNDVAPTSRKRSRWSSPDRR